MIQFEWDSNKNITNKQKHNISFETAQYVFLDPVAHRIYNRKATNEDRWQIIGKIIDVVIFVIYTERNDNIRIISARKANKKEKVLYYGNQ